MHRPVTLFSNLYYLHCTYDIVLKQSLDKLHQIYGQKADRVDSALVFHSVSNIIFLSIFLSIFHVLLIIHILAV